MGKITGKKAVKIKWMLLMLLEIDKKRVFLESLEYEGRNIPEASLEGKETH